MSDRARDRADRCPGVLRPWIADDGALVRLRVVGGELTTATLAEVLRISERHGDGDVHLTKRANLQIRGIAHDDGCVPSAFVDDVKAAGLLPSPSHELVRNIMISPLTGRSGGRADLRPVAHALDEALCDDPELAGLAGRFLFVLDDGRGDVAGRDLDLGLMAVDADAAQLRIGSHRWGEVVALADAPAVLVEMARRFATVRGEPPVWHVDELADDRLAVLGAQHARDLRTQVTSFPLPYGTIGQDDGTVAEHVDVPDGLLTPGLGAEVLARAGESVVVTPWRSMLLPDLPGGDQR